MSESEFVDWMLYLEHQNDMVERQRQGLPMHDGDDADDMTPEQSAQHVTAIFGQIATSRPHG